MSRSKLGWAVITGASAGLGVEFARQLAARGYDVVLIARRRAKLAELADEITAKYDVTAEIIECDLSAPGASGRVMSELQTRLITPMILVNNAGVGPFGKALDEDVELHSATIRLNVLLLTELTLLVGAKMVARKSGAILNVASTIAFQPSPYAAVYGATKAYVLNFSLALDHELAKDGVRVHTICPGPTKTDFFQVNNITAESPEFAFMSAQRCVELGLRAMDRGRTLTITGFANAIGAIFARRTPLWLVTRITGHLMRPSTTKALPPKG